MLRIVAMGASVVDSVGQRRHGSGGSRDTGNVGACVGELRCGRRWCTGGAGEELAAPPNRNHGCGLACKHSERKAGVILEYKLDSSTECHSSVMSVFHNGKTANLICTMAK